jgi:hypothetical protein
MIPTHLLLELQAAATPFLSSTTQISNGRRSRLRSAVVAVVNASNEPVQPQMVTTQHQALSALRLHLARCHALGIPWNVIVAAVNRDHAGSGHEEPYRRIG